MAKKRYLDRLLGSLAIPSKPISKITTSKGIKIYCDGGCSSLGAGNSNTINISASCGSSSAAYYAYYLSTGGYSDWYLPSYTELQKIYSNKSSLSIPNNYYWSSSQYNSNSAYLFYFGTGTFYSQAKNNYYYALPIRQF